MSPVPKFSNGAITLRRFTPEDAPDLHSYLNHPGLAGCRYIDWDIEDTLPLSQTQVGKLIEKWNEKEHGFCYAIARTGPEPILIGHAEANWDWDPHSPNCSVVISPEYQRQGYGSQVLALLLDYLYGFTIAHNISNWIAEWNTPALLFAEKNGFKRVGLIRRDNFQHGKFVNAVVVDILRPEWKERSHAA